MDTYHPKLNLLLEKTLETIHLGLPTRGDWPPDPAPQAPCGRKRGCNQNSFISVFHRLSFEQIQQIQLKGFLMIQSNPFALHRWVNGPRDHSNLPEVPAQDTAKHRLGCPELARRSLQPRSPSMETQAPVRPGHDPGPAPILTPTPHHTVSEGNTQAPGPQRKKTQDFPDQQ